MKKKEKRSLSIISIIVACELYSDLAVTQLFIMCFSMVLVLRPTDFHVILSFDNDFVLRTCVGNSTTY
ncbi:hypothetical protein QVD17_29136 [Tagetes erecta]|uniref:Uncharacterized protein n=1 Tax=Tagetes erecta TaxID=13708 RepID=A0AAD8KBE8_TARER|nr:hypothetical protein QVD17_29136 [Tagetes erecta]